MSNLLKLVKIAVDRKAQIFVQCKIVWISKWVWLITLSLQHRSSDIMQILGISMVRMFSTVSRILFFDSGQSSVRQMARINCPQFSGVATCNSYIGILVGFAKNISRVWGRILSCIWSWYVPFLQNLFILQDI